MEQSLPKLLNLWTKGNTLRDLGYLQIEGAEAVRWLLGSDLEVLAVVGKASSLTSLEPEIFDLRQRFPERVLAMRKNELAEALGFSFDRGVVALAKQPEQIPKRNGSSN